MTGYLRVVLDRLLDVPNLGLAAQQLGNSSPKELDFLFELVGFVTCTFLLLLRTRVGNDHRHHHRLISRLRTRLAGLATPLIVELKGVDAVLMTDISRGDEGSSHVVAAPESDLLFGIVINHRAVSDSRCGVVVSVNSLVGLHAAINNFIYVN